MEIFSEEEKRFISKNKEKLDEIFEDDQPYSKLNDFLVFDTSASSIFRCKISLAIAKAREESNLFRVDLDKWSSNKVSIKIFNEDGITPLSSIRSVGGLTLTDQDGKDKRKDTILSVFDQNYPDSIVYNREVFSYLLSGTTSTIADDKPLVLD